MKCQVSVLKMAMMKEIEETIREVGKLLVEREEANLQRYSILIGNQEKQHRPVTVGTSCQRELGTVESGMWRQQ